MKLEQFHHYALDFLLPLAEAQVGVLLQPVAGSTEARSPEVLKETFRQAYRTALQEAFAKVVAIKAGNGADPLKAFAKKTGKKGDLADRISKYSLVDEEALDAQLDIEKHGRDMHGKLLTGLSFLSMRIEKLGGKEFEVTANPLHPRQAGHYLRMACEATTKNHGLTQAAISRWIALAEKEYANWLAQWNEALIAGNVLPHLDDDSIHERYVRREEEQARAKAMRKEMVANITGKPLGEDDDLPPSREIMQQLAALIRQTSQTNSAVAPHVFAGNPLGAQAGSAEVLAELAHIRSLDLGNLVRDAKTGYIEAPPQGTLAEVLKQDTTLGQKALDEQMQGTVTLLSMLFERFRADENIAPPIQALMSALQVPMLKSAVSNPDFLIDTESPAQQLMNEMARVGSQWSPKPDARRDAVYQKLEAVVQDIQEKAEAGEDAFEENLQELNSFIKDEERKAALMNERAIAAEQARARLEAARYKSRSAIATRIGEHKLPVHVATFIQDHWQRVLFFLYNKDPEGEGADIQTALTDLDELLAAVQGEPGTDISALVTNLDRHMTEAGHEETSRKPLLIALEQELKALQQARQELEAEQARIEAAQQQALAAEPGEEMAAPAKAHEDTLADMASLVADIAPVPSMADTGPAVEAAPLSLETISEGVVDLVEISIPVTQDAPPEPVPELAQDEFDHQAANLHSNSWFNHRKEAGATAAKIKLAAIIKHNLSYVFVTREGIKALTLHRNEVAEKLRNGELQVIENAALFDRTLEGIITGMRR